MERTRPPDLRKITDAVIDGSPADQTEVIATERDAALTRFANGEIHQNVAETGISVRIRVVKDGRVGVASTNQADDASLRRALKLAIDGAATQPVQAELPRMAGPSTIAAPGAAAEVPGPDERADHVGEICRLADRQGVRAFGAVATGTTTYAVANSNGLFLQTERPIAQLSVVAMADGGNGYSARVATGLDGMDAEAAGAEAVAKAQRGAGAEAIEPGHYPVVLQEYAVAELLEYLSEIGFSAQAVDEGRSFMRPGEKITGDLISIWDDGNDPAGLPMPFDFEGVPRRRVDLVTEGVATGLVHDLASAARANVASTGHGLPSPNPWGAWASNLFIKGGEASSAEELAEGIERGVWVTRFWYVNPVQPRHSVLTGMTREGTFLIENGKVTRPIKNMRFTQSVMEAFASCSGLTRDTMLLGGTDYDYIAALRVPAMRLDTFNFTSVTR